jgi:hypothetical protein
MSSPTGPDWKSLLPQLLGQAGGLTGNRGFAKRWAELEQQKRQQGLVDSEEQRRQQDQQMQQQQLQMQQEAAQRAQEQQRMASLNSLRQLLDVNQVADMDEYAQREAFATRLAPTLGIDAGFIQSLRPNPTRFEVNEAKKMLAEIDKTYAPAQLAMLEQDDQTGSAPVFTLKSGKQMTVGQLRQLAGTQPIDPKTGRPASMRVPAKPATPDVPNTSEEHYVADALAAAEEAAGRPLSRGEKAQTRLKAKREWTAEAKTASGPADQIWVVRAGRPTPIQKGSARPGDLPYDAVAARQGTAGSDGPSAYSVERAQRTIQSVDELMGQVSRWNTGFGSLLAFIPESDAKYFSEQVKTLAANIAFNELTAMREASKTGGALGNVSNVELGLLQNALGVLSTSTKPEQVKTQLQRIKDSINRWMTAVKANTAQRIVDTPGGAGAAAADGTVDLGGGFSFRELP